VVADAGDRGATLRYALPGEGGSLGEPQLLAVPPVGEAVLDVPASGLVLSQGQGDVVAAQVLEAETTSGPLAAVAAVAPAPGERTPLTLRTRP